MIKQIINSSSPIFNKPNNKSRLETEGLFGESVKVINEKGSWTFCKLLTDNYLGWINTKDLGNKIISTHRIISNRTFIYSKPEVKSMILNYLPMGSIVNCKLYNQNWFQLYNYNRKGYEGFIPLMDIVNKNHQVIDWVSSIENLSGTPYKWGGRDTIGIDCSALIQLGLQTKGIKFPRNSVDQNKICKTKINFKNISRGDLIFWENHVGVMVNKKKILHANAHFMSVVIEPLVEVINRIGTSKKFEIKNVFK